MCNLYVMYYLEDGTAMGVDCPNEQNPAITQLLPADSDSPLPPNPDLELKAKSGHASSSAAVDKASKHKTVGKKVLNPVEEGKNALQALNWSGSFPQFCHAIYRSSHIRESLCTSHKSQLC